MPDEIITNNQDSVVPNSQPAEPAVNSVLEPTPEAQVTPPSAPTATEPAQMPPEAPEAPSADPTVVIDTAVVEPVSPAPKISIPHQNSEIPNLGGQVEPAQNKEVVSAENGPLEVTLPATELETAHTTPRQNQEVSNSDDKVSEPNVSTEVELLAAEIAQRKLLKPSSLFMKWLRAKALVTRQQLARKKLDKIMALFNQHEKITSELVRKNLYIPKRTVNNYFDILEREGKIKQVGTPGQKVFYVKQ